MRLFIKNKKLIYFKNHKILLKSKNKYFKINLNTCSIEQIIILRSMRYE